MKYSNSLTDDKGDRWEFRYTEDMFVPVLGPGGEPLIVDGEPVTTSLVSELRFRKEGEDEWRSLPPWADITDDWKITLCLFDEDAEGDLRFWEVKS